MPFLFGTDENRKKAVEALEAEAKAEQKPFPPASCDA